MRGTQAAAPKSVPPLLIDTTVSIPPPTTPIPKTPPSEAEECPVCIGFLCDPITLACHHSFCRACLLKSTRLSPDGRSCPLCRAPIEIQDVKTLPAAAALETAVRALVLAEAYEAKLLAHEKEVEELFRVEQHRLPIFFMPPGTAVGAPVMLHLFEPRYKILIRRSWEGNRLFVYCAGVPRPGGRGVIVRVDGARFLPDGRANIVGQGVQAVRLGETWIEEESGGLFCTQIDDVLQAHLRRPQPPTATRPTPAEPEAARASGDGEVEGSEDQLASRRSCIVM